jgi:hypothetical protein
MIAEAFQGIDGKRDQNMLLNDLQLAEPEEPAPHLSLIARIQLLVKTAISSVLKKHACKDRYLPPKG